jgi:hypothetical protein
VGLSIPQVKVERPGGKQSGVKALTDAPNVVSLAKSLTARILPWPPSKSGTVSSIRKIPGEFQEEVNKVFQSQLVPVSETVFVIPAKAGIQFFRSGPLLSQG